MSIQPVRLMLWGRLALAILSLGLVGDFASAQDSTRGNEPLPDNWPLNTKGLPRFSKALPATGEVTFNLKNPSHFPMWVQIRTGDKGVEFLLDGKQIKKVSLPIGEYAVYFRFKNDIRMRIGPSFDATKNGIIYDHDEKMNRRDDVDVSGKLARRR